MRKYDRKLLLITIMLLAIVSFCGLFSINFMNAYTVENVYGDTVKLYGTGIYAVDSYFKAPIFIGTDVVIFFLVMPMMVYHWWVSRKNLSDKVLIKRMSLYSVTLYYAACLSFGVMYNRLHLIYIALFGCSLFGVFSTYLQIKKPEGNYLFEKGERRFLILCGIALIVAWLPDILPTLIKGTPLPLIEVYTTEITYVLDMGIVAPLCWITYALLKKQDPLGRMIFPCLLQLCFVVGVMMITQSIFQILSGVNLPIGVIVTKSLSFMVLGGFAAFFNVKFYKKYLASSI